MKEKPPTISTPIARPPPNFSQKALYEPLIKKPREDDKEKPKEDDKEIPFDSDWAEKEIMKKERTMTTPIKLEPLKLKEKWMIKDGGLDLPGRRGLYQSPSPRGWKLMSPKRWWDWTENEVTTEVEHQITQETIIQHVESNIMAGNIPADIDLVIIS
jgi:hypothetical protein